MRSFPSALACAVLFIFTSTPAGAASQTNSRELNPAEKWVVAQVTAGEGEEANLSKQFPADKDRKLRAHFLEDLLTGALPGVKPHRHGVGIIGAIIDEPIDLENAQIPCQVGLAHCHFNKSVTFARASFAGTVSFDDSRFKAEATFSGMKVGHTAFFRKAVFEGPVTFASADIAWQFVANEAQFENKNVEQGANFNSMKVRGGAFFSNAVFEGPVNFVGVDIANFEAQEAKFQNKEQEASFSGMKVGYSAFFRKAVFEGPVDFTLADIASNFEAVGAKFNNKEKEASFNSMKVRGDAFFKNAVFEGPVDFSYADVAWLDLSVASWPKVAAQFHMQGMSYKYVRAVPNNEPESHKALLKLADQSFYTADVYSNLEEFFLRQGYRGDADRAFIAGKRRERKENLHGSDWLGSWLLDWLVGYGRHPWQAGIPCAVLVALGCVLFSPKKMEPQKPDDAPRVYSRFWYSLGLFLPVVDLQADKVWKPRADQTFLRNYMRVHIMLGWILIPIVLAALTGLIK